MTPTDLSAVVAELAAIKLMLYAIGALVVVSVVLTCLRSYAQIRQFVQSRLGEQFRQAAQLLLEQNKLGELAELSKRRVAERPLDPDGHWYLARALLHQGQFDEALAAFEATRRLAPTWSAEYIDPWVAQINASDHAARTG
jgi:cytochrome c-type biogenesis protein CcmH/NrfG